MPSVREITCENRAGVWHFSSLAATNSRCLSNVLNNLSKVIELILSQIAKFFNYLRQTVAGTLESLLISCLWRCYGNDI